jgi:hypothetical protein
MAVGRDEPLSAKPELRWHVEFVDRNKIARREGVVWDC